jgi:hypothetical protein
MRMSLVVGAVAMLWSRSAFPCSGLTCEDVILPVPRAGSTIPANAPAIGVQRALFATRSPDGGTWVRPPTSLRPQVMQVVIRDGGTGGGVVSLPTVNSNVGVFVGTPVWQVGSTWRIEYAETEPGAPATCQADSEFVIGPAVPFPTVSSTVTELDSEWVPASQTGCGAFPEAQLVRFRVQPTAEMVPWLPLARWELEVDGRNVSAAPFGSVLDAGLEVGSSGQQAFLPLNVLQVECNPTNPNSIGPGLHAVRFLALIEGIGSPIPSNTVMVQVACTPADGGRPDAGPPDASFWPLDDGGFPSNPSGDGGGGFQPDASMPIVLDGGASMVSSPLPPGGCSSVPVALAPSLLLALWLHARRRANG